MNGKVSRLNNKGNVFNCLTPINIDDDSDNEEEKMLKENKNNEKLEKYIETGCQTDSFDMIKVLKKIVNDRFKQYEIVYSKEAEINGKVDLTLSKLRQENVDLRKEIVKLKAKLQQCDNKGIKRSVDGDLPLPKKLTVSSSSFHPENHQTVLSKSEIGISSNTIMQPNRNLTSINHSVKNNFRQMEPNMMQNRLRASMQVVSPDRGPNLMQNIYRAPVQVVPTVQPVGIPRQLQRSPFERHRFIFVDENNQIIGSNMPGVNTQVVESNQGMRMAPLTPNGQQRIHNTQGINRLNGLNQYQEIINMPRFPTNVTIQPSQRTNVRHFPPQRFQTIIPRSSNRQELPKLKASISASDTGIIITWDYEVTEKNPDSYRKVECYHLFAHQAKDNRVQPPTDIKQWKKIGVVNALPLPMACTLTQFATGNVYFFAVLSVDIHGKEGELSNPCIIRLNLDG